MTFAVWRRTLAPVVGPLGRRLQRLSPNQITVASFVLAAGGGALVACGRLSRTAVLGGVALLLLHVLADYLDGEVARATGRTSRLGDFLDHVLDRCADLVVLGGVAASGLARLELALSALSLCLLVGAVNVQVELSTRRRRDAAISRTDGQLLLVLVLAVQAVLPLHLLGLSLVDWALLIYLPLAATLAACAILRAARQLQREPDDE